MSAPVQLLKAKTDAVEQQLQQVVNITNVIVNEVDISNLSTKAETAAAIQEALKDYTPQTGTGAGDSSTLKPILSKLITYLENWINVGNLSMSDIRSIVDSDGLLSSSSQ